MLALQVMNTKEKFCFFIIIHLFIFVSFLETYIDFSYVLQSEMKMYGCDTIALKQHFGKKLMELEEEKSAVQVCQIILECDHHRKDMLSHST